MFRANSSGLRRFMSLTGRSSPDHTRVLPTAQSIADFRKLVVRWWNLSGRVFPWRRTRASLYHQVISEVLLQRTKAETVAAFWPSFINRFPNWQSIASAPLEEVERILKPIGLSKQRSPRLKALASIIAQRNGRFPRIREEIEGLPGVGQYIANAIELFSGDEARPLVDVNMARVLERYFGPRKLADIRYDPYLQSLAHRVVDGANPKDVNWAILDFAAVVCSVSRPNCAKCPLHQRCLHFNSQNAAT